MLQAYEQAAADKGAGFIQRCVSNEQAQTASGYVGLTEDEAGRRAVEQGQEIRVVGRDGTCLDRTSDLREGRVNVIIVAGRVLWVGRF